MAPLYFQFLCILLFNINGNSRCKAQDETMTRYIERRILALEDRLYKCEQVVQQHIHDYTELSHKLLTRLDRFNKYKSEVRNEMDNLLVRVERAEWDIDYLETTNAFNAGVDVDEELLEDEFLEHTEEKRRMQLKVNTSDQFHNKSERPIANVRDNRTERTVWNQRHTGSSKCCTTMLALIKSQKTVKKAGGPIGSWLKNVGNDSQKIYFFSGASGNFFLEFGNIKDFTSRDYLQKAGNISMPCSWQGTGHVLYNNNLYFHRNDTLNEIVVYNPWKDRVVRSFYLHEAGHMPPYQLSPFTRIDLAVDEQGVWAIHADSSQGGKIVLSKVEHENMEVKHAWNTSCDSNNAEAGFVICGTLYVVYNSPSGGRSHIDCIYDTSGVIQAHEMPTLYFPKRYSSHSSVHYSPTDQALYAWDEGYQILYKFDTRAKFESPLE